MIRSAVPESPEWHLDPLGFIAFFWPHVRLYDKQVQILESIRDNDTTISVAGNMLGKDFIAGLANIWFFASRTPARGLTTSVDQDQLEGVLWGEMRRFLKEARFPLPIQMNFLLMRKIIGKKGELCPISELVGRVARTGEGYLGRHLPRDIPRSFVTHDEASSIDDTNLNATDTWAHRTLLIGNPYPCTNRFYKSVKRGDLPHKTKPGRFYEKVVTIRGIDSPNVRYGIEAAKLGMEPKVLLPGVMPYDEYMKRRETWDPMRQSIGLDAEFYEGHEVKLFPASWRNISSNYAASLTGVRKAKAMGIDGGEGGDNTVWLVVDDDGVMFIQSQKTPDTAVIGEITVSLMNRFGLEPDEVWFDAGGGGAAQAGFLRRKYGNKPGMFPQVSFAEVASDPNRFKRMRTSRQKKAASEQTMRYKNRRAEMYGLVRELIDPGISDRQFGIPNSSSDPEQARVYVELQRQLSLFPYNLDGEGKMWLPPKRKKERDSDEVTLTEIIGNSPDESDALVLAVYGLYNKGSKFIAGQTKGIVGAA